MMSRSSRLIAALLQSDRRRLAASFLAPLLLGLSFGFGYVAALSVGAADAITPVDQPLVATVDHGPARITAPQPPAPASSPAAASMLKSIRSIPFGTALYPLSLPS